MSKSTAEDVKAALRELANPEKAEFFPRFFKTGPGEYGEGDKFIGVVVPDQRKTARRFRDLPFDEVALLLEDEYHECRLTALLILTEKYSRDKTESGRAAINAFYLNHLDGVNNWDLVDSSAHKILGAELVRTGRYERLNELAESDDLWRNRIAVIATLALIKKKQFGPTLKLCRQFLDHPHDLIHKATGWMLREVGKIKRQELETFLARHAAKMPRTMLRYSIEKLPADERQRWMQKS
jgi:3-methyladenine DNA glycosylase AlkD